MNDMHINQYQPNSVSPPGETLLEALTSIGMSQAELATRTGRPKKTINEIIKGKAAITPETALQLEKALSIPASFWNNRERNYREALARNSDRRRLEKYVSWIKEFPISAMIKWGWIQKKEDDVEQVEELLKFFGISAPKSLSHLQKDVCFRRSSAYEGDIGACIAWLRKGIIEGQKIVCEPYEPTKFKNALLRARALTRTDPKQFVPELQSLSAHAGVAVVFIPELPKIAMWEATRWLGPEKALIQLCLRYKTDDHLWFSFFHGAGHVYLHGKREVFTENKKEQHPNQEREADDFAKDLLIDHAAFNRFVAKRDYARESIIRFADAQGIAPGIVVGRLQHEKRLPYSIAYDLKKRFVWGVA